MPKGPKGEKRPAAVQRLARLLVVVPCVWGAVLRARLCKMAGAAGCSPAIAAWR